MKTIELFGELNEKSLTSLVNFFELNPLQEIKIIFNKVFYGNEIGKKIYELIINENQFRKVSVNFLLENNFSLLSIISQI
jgi:hypothetical protein